MKIEMQPQACKKSYKRVKKTKGMKQNDAICSIDGVSFFELKNFLNLFDKDTLKEIESSMPLIKS